MTQKIENRASQTIERTNNLPYSFSGYGLADTLESAAKQTNWHHNSVKHKIQEFLISGQQSPKAINFILNHLSEDHDSTYCINSNIKLNFIYETSAYYNSIINLISLNRIKQINRFLNNANNKLNENGTLIGITDCKEHNPPGILSDLHELLKSLLITKSHFSKKHFGDELETHPAFRKITKAEIYGRLYCYGFELLDEQVIDNKLYFVAIKRKIPNLNLKNQSGFLIKLPRIVKDKKVKYFYKIRTMYPYSEYLQEYMINAKGLESGGKIKSDFRVSKLGKFLRKYWLDEMPMIINLLKGDIKLVGVRPLSPQYFSLYSVELQNLRIKTKPGLIPPFYVDFPKTFQEIMLSEFVYLQQYQKHPILTDIKYFFLAGFNIVFKGYRSQ